MTQRCAVGLETAKPTMTNVSRLRTLHLLLVLLIQAVPTIASGHNLLTNATFDSGIVGWTKNLGTCPAEWTPQDASGLITSGATKFTCLTAIRQCVPVQGGNSYVVGAATWVALGSPPNLLGGADVEWFDTLDCSAGGGPGLNTISTMQGKWIGLDTIASAPPSARSARFMLYTGFLGDFVNSPINVYFDNAFFGLGTCASGPTKLCLNQGRFQVEVTWTTNTGTSGSGMAIPFAADSGSFWFFSPTNIELDVKVLDACVSALGNRYWVFAAGLTNVHVVLTVTDTKTGYSRTYTNPQGSVFESITDTNAFPTCP